MTCQGSPKLFLLPLVLSPSKTTLSQSSFWKIQLSVWALLKEVGGFPGGSVVKHLPANAGDVGSIPGSEDPLEKETTTQSSKYSCLGNPTEEPGGL